MLFTTRGPTLHHFMSEYAIKWLVGQSADLSSLDGDLLIDISAGGHAPLRVMTSR